MIDRATAARLGLTVEPDRQHALRRLRPAPGLDDLHAAATSTTSSWRWRREYWQSPDTLEPDLCQHRRRRGQRHPSRPTPCAGTVLGQARRRTNSSSAATTAAQIAGDAARNQANNALANTGRSATSTGAAVSTRTRTMVPLSAFAHFGPGNTPLAVNHQGLFVARRSRSTCSRASRSARRPRRSTQAMARLDVPATIHGTFQGTAQGVSAIARQPAAPDRGGTARRLHRARRALRELRPPDHDPVDPAVGRGRRGAGADAVRHRVQHHRADRRHPADRHRQEERDHDDRLRARRRAQRGARPRARRSTRPACCASARS